LNGLLRALGSIADEHGDEEVRIDFNVETSTGITYILVSVGAKKFPLGSLPTEALAGHLIHSSIEAAKVSAPPPGPKLFVPSERKTRHHGGN
jgi:hypothetical protein